MATKFTGDEGEYIVAIEASKRQNRFLEKEKKNGKENPVRAQFYGKKMIEEMLSRKGAMGIRIYFGENEDGNPNLVLVPADAKGKNLVKDTTGLKDMPDHADYGSNGPECPQHC